jgi:hypothetical protein
VSTHCLDFALLMPTLAPAIGEGIQVSALAPITTQWAAAGTGGGGIPDAPSDGNPYVRMNAAWTIGLTPNSVLDAGTF